MSIRPLALRSLCMAAALAAPMAGASSPLATNAHAQDPHSKQPSAALPFIRLEGCIVDQNLRPIAGTAVRVDSPGGASLGQAVTNESGEFTLRVVSLTVYSLSFGSPVPTKHVVRADQKDLWMTYCLREGGD